MQEHCVADVVGNESNYVLSQVSQWLHNFLTKKCELNSSIYTGHQQWMETLCGLRLYVSFDVSYM
jgi:hypothetical protein